MILDEDSLGERTENLQKIWLKNGKNVNSDSICLFIESIVSTRKCILFDISLEASEWENLYKSGRILNR